MTATYTAKDITMSSKASNRCASARACTSAGSAPPGCTTWCGRYFDNAIDEAMNGHASEIGVVLHKDGKTVTISDNGRGIPVDIHPKHKKPALEIILCTLHAGGKFTENNYKTAGGLHGVGRVGRQRAIQGTHRDRQARRQRVLDDVQARRPAEQAQAQGRGTRHRHDHHLPPRPDDLPQATSSTPTPSTTGWRSPASCTRARGSASTTRSNKHKVTFQHKEGIAQYLDKIVKDRHARPINDGVFTLEKDNGLRIETVLRWTESTDEHVRSYVNGIPTGSGGHARERAARRADQGRAQLHRDAQPHAARRQAHARGRPRGVSSRCSASSSTTRSSRGRPRTG